MRHLLDHTSGLADLHLWQLFTVRASPDDALRDHLVRPGQRLHARTRPGAQFLYSNVGYTLLGLLIEAATGERYEHWVDRNVLLPLGMTRSTMTFVSQEGVRADRTLAMGHFDGFTPQAAYAIPVRPAAQFTTTPSDMARLIRFLMSDGTVNGRVLVDRALLRAMGEASTTDAVRAGLAGGYGLGLVTRERWGSTGRCHLGNVGTFRAMLCVHRDQQRGVFVAYNSDPESLPWDAVDSLVVAALRLPAEAAVPVAPLSVDADAWRGWYLAQPRFEQFAYLDVLGSAVRASWDGQRFVLAPLGGMSRTLEPVGGRSLRLVGRRAATHVLLRAGDTLRITDGQRTLTRVPVAMLLAYWSSAAVGAVALLALLGVGGVRTWRAARSGGVRREPLRWIAGAMLLLLASAPLHLLQPALAIGDATTATVTTAFATGAVPIALAGSALSTMREWQRLTRVRRWCDALALLGAGQWVAVLAWWGLMPLVLWR
ncbi:MAG: beta-lactamase family protein [Gemmatimonadaceae bacterium]|nr:beta-lactamase family protein [Gemmatimonadaceae bacterium]